MKIYIDQSGKIEQTNRMTVLAFSNGKVKTIKISAVEKQKLIKSLQELRRPHKTYIYQIFAALVFILLKSERITEVVIDKEYPGHEVSIKEVLLQMYQKSTAKQPDILFDYVTKKSRSHIAALEVFQGKKKANLIVKTENILEEIYA